MPKGSHGPRVDLYDPRFLEFVQSGTSIECIAEHFQISRATVARHMQILEEEGVLTRETRVLNYAQIGLTRGIARITMETARATPEFTAGIEDLDFVLSAGTANGIDYILEVVLPTKDLPKKTFLALQKLQELPGVRTARILSIDIHTAKRTSKLPLDHLIDHVR